MGNSIKITSTRSPSPTNSNISLNNECHTNYCTKQHILPSNPYSSCYYGWLQPPPPYPLYPSSYPSMYSLPSQTQSISTSTPILLQSSLSTKPLEPSVKDFLEELDKKFGVNKYTIYLQKFEKEEILVSQIAEMSSETLCNEFGIEIVGRRLNLIKEAKKYI